MRHKKRGFLCSMLAFLLTGCGAFPVDLAITTSRKAQYGLEACVFVKEAGVQMGQQQISARVWGFVKGRDWWGAPSDVVWPPEPGVA